MKTATIDLVLAELKALEAELNQYFEIVDRITLTNQRNMLTAFQMERIGSHHFQNTTGYGYHDAGRDALERVFARVFRAERALVRQQLVSGTHAITCAILGNLSPADEMIIASGTPYETLATVLGLEEPTAAVPCQGRGFGVRTIQLNSAGQMDQERILAALTPAVRMVFLQRSCGYSERDSFTISKLAEICSAIKKIRPEIIIMVDNCYGEFVEEREPLEIGADLIAGSLIKNPGGCLAPCGGYIAGKTKLVERAAERLYAPGIGSAIGPSLLSPQLFFQGFFEAPQRVGEMVKGAVLIAAAFARRGYKVTPIAADIRTDIIQKVYFNSPEALIAFCQSVQRNSPIESNVRPEPALLPGYTHRVIMGGGSFTTGATSEFSADAPLVSPYIAYIQGGLSYPQIKLSLAGLLADIGR
jgi:cystathionine beta-lyase family protein involved in aluminum resistance